MWLFAISIFQKPVDTPEVFDIWMSKRLVPPGDCVIFEFTPETKERTDLMCQFYQIAIDKGDVQYNE